MQETYITFQFYNKKGQRLTIYYNGNGKVTLIPCLRTDHFVKKVGKEMCSNTFNSLKSIENFNITFYKQKDFLDWCRITYFKKSTTERYLEHDTFFVEFVKGKHGKKLVQHFLYKESIR